VGQRRPAHRLHVEVTAGRSHYASGRVPRIGRGGLDRPEHLRVITSAPPELVVRLATRRRSRQDLVRIVEFPLIQYWLRGRAARRCVRQLLVQGLHLGPLALDVLQGQVADDGQVRPWSVMAKYSLASLPRPAPSHGWFAGRRVDRVALQVAPEIPTDTSEGASPQRQLHLAAVLRMGRAASACRAPRRPPPPSTGDALPARNSRTPTA